MVNITRFGRKGLQAACFASVSGLAMVSMPAVAQDAPAAEDTSSNTVITVTARKREETVLEVPLAISAFSPEAIQELGVQTTADLSAYTPGFDFQEVGQGGSSGRENPNIRFRGVAVQNENPAARAGAVFYEGAYLSAGAGLLPLFDLGRVEVVKGPQNAFFGRNTFAGAVNFIAAEPGDEVEGFVNGIYSPSDQDTYQLSGAVSLPVAENLGLRVGAYYRRAGADFTFDNGDPLGEEETLALQGTLLFDNGPVRLKTTGFYVDASDTRGIVSLDFTNAPGACNLTYSGDIRSVASGEITGSFTTDLSQSARGTFCGSIPDYDENGFNVSAVGSFAGNTVPLDFFSGSVEYNQTLPPEALGFAIPNSPNGIGNEYYTWRVNQTADIEVFNDHTLSGLFSYGQAGSYRIADTLHGQGPQMRLSAFANYSEDLIGEIRITSSDDSRLRYVFGYSHISSKTRTIEFSAFAGFGGMFDDQPLTFIDLDSDALFGSVDFDVTDALTLSLEGRYAWDTLTTVLNGATLRDFGPGDTLPDRIEGVQQTMNRFMPRVLLSYNPSDELNIYGSFALSYLLGNDTNAADYAVAVPSAGLNADTVGQFTPIQKLTAYEIGVKGQISGNLNYAIAAYFMDWKNQVQFELSPFFVPLFTAGDSEYTGIEAELVYSPTPWLTFNGNFNWVDAKFTDFAGAGSVAAQILNPALEAGTQISSIGGTPRYIPEWTGAAGVNFNLGDVAQLDRDITLRLDAIYFGDFYIDNFEYNQVNGSWKLNARASFEVTPEFRIDLYALNLTDDLSYTPSGGTTTGIPFPDGMGGTFNTRRTFGTLPRAREIGLEVRFDF